MKDQVVFTDRQLITLAQGVLRSDVELAAGLFRVTRHCHCVVGAIHEANGRYGPNGFFRQAYVDGPRDAQVNRIVKKYLAPLVERESIADIYLNEFNSELAEEPTPDYVFLYNDHVMTKSPTALADAIAFLDRALELIPADAPA